MQQKNQKKEKIKKKKTIKETKMYLDETMTEKQEEQKCI